MRIAQIAVRSSGWVPSLELRDVELLDAEHRPALRLPHVFAAISPRSLLSFELRFEQLLIDGAQLEVKRDASGRIFVAGLPFSQNGIDDKHGGSAAADWFFAQHEFVIRAGALRWTDEQRGAAPLALGDVQLVVRNGLRQHDIRIDATPPADWGDRFTAIGRFTQPLLARRGDWQRWSGSAYASLPRADVHALRQHVDLPFELSEGIGALRGWFTVDKGQPQAATVDVALRAVTLRLAPQVDPLTVEEVQGRLVGQRTADGATLALQGFSFETADDIRWPRGDMQLMWRQREGEAATGGSFSAQRLDVGLMAQVASRVPLGAPLRRLLAELNPQGVVSDASIAWEGPLDAPLRYRAKGAASGLSLSALPSAEPGGMGRPGLRNAALQLDASETGGQARIAITDGSLDLPGVFEEPVLPLAQLSTTVQWTIEPPAKAAPADQPPRITVQVKDAHFANADAKGELKATWRPGPGTGVARGGRYPGRLELDGKLSNGLAARVYRYLPLGIGADTRRYVQQGVQSGRLVNASFRVNGDLWDFPFSSARGSKEGEFRITARVEDARYAFVPGMPPVGDQPGVASPWPTLAKTSVDINLEHNTLELRNGQAQVGNLEFRGVQGAVRNLDGDASLALDLTARGPLTEMLGVVNTTPVNDWIAKALVDSTATGNADLKLSLALPLMHLDHSGVKGSVALAGNDVRITPGSPLLGAAKGRVDFTQKGFTVVGASARLYGGDATFDGGSQPDGAVRFSGQGIASAEGLRRAPELGAAARLAASLSGQASYRMMLAFVHGTPELNITSNLVGLGSSLPAPLNKAADTPLMLRYENTTDPASATTPPLRDTLRFELGNLVQAQYQRDLSGEQPRVLRGGIGVMAPAPQPPSGVAASVVLGTLVTDDWTAVADKLAGNGASTSISASTSSNPGPNASASPAPMLAPGPAPGTEADRAAQAGYVPDTVALRVQELAAGPRRLTHVVAGLSQTGGLWRANVDADQLNGYVEYRLPSKRGGAATAGGRVYARLSRLVIPKSDVDQVESLLDQQPSTLPALDVVVDDVDLRGKRLGRVEIEAVNRAGGLGPGPAAGRDGAQEWQLSKFNITLPEAQLTATGHWSAAPGSRGTPVPRRTVMDFKLAVADSGALLTRLGTPGAIRGGKGQLSGQIAWLGSPFSLDAPTLSGQVNVAIDAGQFLKAEPGAARLLGVLSLQSLPRRLSFDFRDLFQQGFAFDNVTGDLTIAQGVAHTNNLRMRGVQAVVLMEGSADIARETQDLQVVVVPEVNAGTAALAYAVINPAIGLGAFLAQALLKKPLTAAGTREFQVSGAWDDPKVERVDRKFTDDVPPLAEPEAASAPASGPR